MSDFHRPKLGAALPRLQICGGKLPPLLPPPPGSRVPDYKWKNDGKINGQLCSHKCDQRALLCEDNSQRFISFWPAYNRKTRKLMTTFGVEHLGIVNILTLAGTRHLAILHGTGGMRPPSRLAPDWARALIQKPAYCLSRDKAVDTRVWGPGSTGDLWGQVNDPKLAKIATSPITSYLSRLEPRF